MAIRGGVGLTKEGRRQLTVEVGKVQLTDQGANPCGGFPA